MLELKKIHKEYDVGDGTVKALRDVSLCFRDSEFVSVLGPSGCGKTTLLNIIGGLDRYTSGDLVINGRTTKEYAPSDWDTYRNHSVGFVFQSYNLIPHQTVLANTELALTLSGVSKAERRRRAIKALERVGLGDQLKKKPNQMSGGQMQRVAIARAIVNDPDILLADEPTGALDTETSVQVMEILKEISKTKLIIMVTHNRDLAERYSTRIVSLLDGAVTDDTAPFVSDEPATKPEKPKKKDKKKSMSFFTALSLSFNNLMTKRARTLLTSFAGSIGIIGIALILAMSTGINAYIDRIQRDTLSSYPITLQAQETDLSAILAAMSGVNANAGSDDDTVSREEREDETVYSNPMMYKMFNSFFAAEKKENDLASFKRFLDAELDESTRTTDLHLYASTVSYSYNVPLNCFVKNTDGKYISCDVAGAFDGFGGAGNEQLYNMLKNQMSMLELWSELTPGVTETVSPLEKEQYTLVHGSWPDKADEIVIILDRHGDISDLAFYALGLVPEEEVTKIVTSAINGQEIEYTERKLTYEELCELSLKVVPSCDFYNDNDGDGVYSYIGDTDAADIVINGAMDLHIVGIVSPSDESSASMSVFGYTSLLTQYLIGKAGENPAVMSQLSEENSNFDILSGLPFIITEAVDPSDEYKAKTVKEYFASLTDSEKTELYTKIKSVPPDGYIDLAINTYMADLDTREKMESLIAKSYGMDEQTVKGYLEAYSDEELVGMIRETIATIATENYKKTVQEQVDSIMSTPTDEELASIILSYTAALTSKEAKIAFVAQTWSEKTGMNAQAAAVYLASLSDAELDESVNTVARSAALEAYASLSQANEQAGNAKVAAVFDAEYLSLTDEAQLASLYDLYMPSTTSASTLDDNLSLLGYVDPDSPSAINIYAASFEDKEAISDIIDNYNDGVDEESKISYTDYFAALLSGVTDIINGISIGLIIFVSVSLVVSSIMIGIITYISVLERTKEIGILRAIGASKRDISLVFNAETLIVGLTAGVMGIGLSLACCPLISFIVHTLSGITEINAFLEPEHCLWLIAVSVVLTFVAGLIPSSMAAKKDPVVALRTE